MELAGVRFAVLGISIRTQTPKQHKLEKRLEETERGRDGETSIVGHTVSRLL